MSATAFTLFTLIHSPDVASDGLSRDAFDHFTKVLAAKLIAGDY